MAVDIKDLKNYKRSAIPDFFLKPIDRDKGVDDLPNLETWEVNVMAELGENNSVTGERVKRVKLCRLDKVPDQKQFVFLYDKLEKKKKEYRTGKPEKIGDEKTVSQLIEKYIAGPLAAIGDSDKYQKYLRSIWEPTIGAMDISEVTLDHLLDVRDKMRDAGLAPATINNRTQPIKSVFRYGNNADKNYPLRPKWIEHDITKDLKAIDPNNKTERFLSFDELKRLREQIDLSESENLADLFEFLLAVGCRWSEAMGLTWDCIDFKEGVITFNKVLTRSKYCGSEVVNGKTVLLHERNVLRSGLKNGQNSRIMDLENYPEVLESLKQRRKNQMKNNINSDRVFISNPRKAFETALRRAKIKNFSFHTIRHTCMSYLAQMSATPLELKAHGGHEDIKSVERYSHFDPQLTKRTSNLLRAKIYG